MVRSRLAFLKHLILAIGSLGLCVCGTELGLHVYESWAECAVCRADKSACSPSWTVHHSLKPDVHVTVTDPDLGTEVRWRTNSLGLRGPEVEVPKPPGTFRILCLGDESTLAPETDQNETFCARLKELLPTASSVDLEVINAGCPQTGPLLSFLALRHKLLSLAPDLVVFNFDMSDVADDHRCRRHVRMNGKEPLYCPHPELERQRTASEVFWVERLLLWQHAKRGVGHLLGAEDQAEDVRDIDAPQGAYAWLRDDAARLVGLHRPDARRSRPDGGGLSPGERGVRALGRALSVADFGRGQQRSGRAGAGRPAGTCPVQKPAPLRLARRPIRSGKTSSIAIRRRRFPVPSTRNDCSGITPLAFQRQDTICMLASWNGSWSPTSLGLGGRTAKFARIAGFRLATPRDRDFRSPTTRTPRTIWSRFAGPTRIG